MAAERLLLLPLFTFLSAAQIGNGGRGGRKNKNLWISYPTLKLGAAVRRAGSFVIRGLRNDFDECGG